METKNRKIPDKEQSTQNGIGIGISSLVDIDQVARLLRCSSRHIYRLAGEGKMPQPIKLGALIRWNRQTLETWIEDGCPPYHKDATHA